MKRLNVLFLASEAEPLIKVGGLGRCWLSHCPTLYDHFCLLISGTIRLILGLGPALLSITLQQNCDNAQLISQFYIEHTRKIQLQLRFTRWKLVICRCI